MIRFFTALGFLTLAAHIICYCAAYLGMEPPRLPFSDTEANIGLVGVITALLAKKGDVLLIRTAEILILRPLLWSISFFPGATAGAMSDLLDRLANPMTNEAWDPTLARLAYCLDHWYDPASNRTTIIGLERFWMPQTEAVAAPDKPIKAKGKIRRKRKPRQSQPVVETSTSFSTRLH